MSSPLNKLADALPSFILQMQDIKVRQEYYESLADYRTKALAQRIETDKMEREVREAIETQRNLRGYYLPPEAKLLRDSISSQYRTLTDPNSALLLDDDTIIKRWKKLQGDQADYFGKYEGRISLSTPIAVEEALGRAVKPSPPATIVPPKKKATTMPGMMKTWRKLGAPPTTETPAGFPDPSTLTEGQTATFNGNPWIIRNGQWVEAK